MEGSFESSTIGSRMMTQELNEEHSSGDSQEDLSDTSPSPTFDELKSQANDLFMKKDYELAIQSYKKALELQPYSSVIHLNLAQVYF